MSVFPPAVIYCNNDLTDNILNKLTHQLNIDEVQDGYTFDNNVNNNVNYIGNIKNSGKRLLVLRNLYNQDLSKADVSIFIKDGLATIEKNINTNDTSRASFRVVDLSWYELGFTGDNHSIM